MRGVKLENITKRFGLTVAVNDVSLEIKGGDFFCLLGPSGCGKTTLLRMIAGLEKPDEGRIWIGDDLVYDSSDRTFIPPGSRRIGLVFQSYALWPHMTVEQNILFGLQVRKIPHDVQKRRLNEVNSLLQINGLERRYPNELSGGQQQRVALARELVTGADVLLMDEPLSNLDAQLRIDMRAELKRLHSDTEVTIIYVTHDQVEALSLSSMVSVLRNGVVHQCAPPDDIYNLPRDLFVAGFIGNVRMNMVPARLRNSRLIGDGFEVGCPAHVRSCEFKPLEVLLGVRPESLDIVGSPGEWTIPAKVQSVMPMGSVALTQVSIGDNGTNIVVQHERSYNFGRGDNVYVKFDPDALHVFDAQSELALGR